MTTLPLENRLRESVMSVDPLVIPTVRIEAAGEVSAITR
jgi:hypothetical protein